jgi:predicted phage-related endonuclease
MIFVFTKDLMRVVFFVTEFAQLNVKMVSFYAQKELTSEDVPMQMIVNQNKSHTTPSSVHNSNAHWNAKIRSISVKEM